MRRLVPGLGGLVVAAGFSIWAYARLPGEVVTHWGIDGRPDGYSSPLVAAVLLPAVGFAMAMIFLVLPRIEPRREAYTTPRSPYWVLANAVLALLAVLHILVLGHGLGWAVNAAAVVSVAVGGLFVLIGALMPRMQPNWFMGIRTPWTLSDDQIWEATHRLGGRLFIAAGVVIALSSLAEGNWWLVGVIALAMTLALVPVGYSWWLWRQKQGAGGATRP